MAADWLIERPIAHRGFHDARAGRIENSASAVRAALQRGFAIEVDLRITKDGGVVVFHDATLGRLCGVDKPVAGVPLSSLASQRLIGGEDTILTFAGLLAMVAGRVPLFLELKTDGASDDRLLGAVAAVLAGYRGAVAVMSFDHPAMGRFRRLAPAVPVGLVADGAASGTDSGSLPLLERFVFRHALMAVTIGPRFIAYDVRALPDPGVSLLRRFRSLPVLAWTVRGDTDPGRRKHYDQMIFEGFDPSAIRWSA